MIRAAILWARVDQTQPPVITPPSSCLALNFMSQHRAESDERPALELDISNEGVTYMRRTLHVRSPMRSLKKKCSTPVPSPYNFDGVDWRCRRPWIAMHQSVINTQFRFRQFRIPEDGHSQALERSVPVCGG